MHDKNRIMLCEQKATGEVVAQLKRDTQETEKKKEYIRLYILVLVH